MKSITRFSHNLHGKKCLNCESELSVEDNFCPRCGQVNDMNRLSIKQYFSEYLAGFFEFDNRFLRTVIPLLIKPGTVSKNYVNGKRIYYANPFQLYLHITILFFLLVGLFKTIDSFKPGSQANQNLPGVMNSENREKILDSIKKETLSELQNSEVEIDSATLAAIDLGVNQIAAGANELGSPVRIRQDVESAVWANRSPGTRGGVAYVVAATVKCRQAILGQLAHHRRDVTHAKVVQLQRLTRRQTDAALAVSLDDLRQAAHL